ncbi:hypothetical protein [Sediminibacterium ginsengisoli]|uniref:Uncharacterized protein n=1 Tax=Sediminibacterium ginsengisoli TaxID=413434 RepID=A0A1T4P716_9BACT|nr:hypothetical protein [Sediminibacterium ginsengisoli]SJZ87249.1 hypothetical protein SAMN04488132_105188 [Sediminibacterium ginsengisoli]
MSNYTQNFRNTIISCIEKAQLEDDTAKAANDAAMLTLYHAREAAVAIALQLAQTQEGLSEKKRVREQTAISTNASNAVAESAGHASLCIKQSANVAAAIAVEVQTATTAIITLASDINSIFSIIQAADMDSEMYNQAAELRTLLNETALMAETGAQHSMEILAQIAAVPIVLAENAGRVHGCMTKIQESANDDFSYAMQLQKDQTDRLTWLNAGAKAAQANFENSQAVLDAARQSHEFTNDLLNLSLRVSNISLDKCTVSFTPLKSPFSTTDLQNPVNAYHVLVVKDEKKYLVDISHAENAVQNQWEENTGQPFHNGSTMHSCTLSCNQLRDTDGDPVVAGWKYAVLVYGSYTEAYKKRRNDFDDFLSAPSASFQFGSPLPAVNAQSIIQDTDNPMLLHFEVEENFPYADSVQYRCIFLPHPMYSGNSGESEPDFVCNIDIALEATADSYLVANKTTAIIKKNGTKKATTKTQWNVKIDNNTTDISGNRLINGNSYLPVILSVWPGTDGVSGVTNNWSGYQDVKAIIYSSK